MSKATRIAALEHDVSGIIADITYIYGRINNPRPDSQRPDHAPAALTADDAALAVGDRVEVTGPALGGNRLWERSSGTIVQVDTDMSCMVEISLAHVCFPASSLRKLPAETPDTQPAATAEQPCDHCGRSGCTDWSCSPRVKRPAEQPTPAAQSMAQRIEAALCKIDISKWAAAIRAAAAVKAPDWHTLPGKAIEQRGYNAGIEAVLAAILRELQGGK